MRITVRHHFDFGADRQLVGDDLVRADAWDALRTRTDGAFSIAGTRDELERTADGRPEIGERAQAIEEWLDRHDAHSLASYGVGGGVLEAWLLRLGADRPLILADYAPQTIERLRVLFPETEVVQHDLLADAPLEADVHLFHRIDTEFTDQELRGVLKRFAGKTILVVATEIATGRRLFQELVLRTRNRHLTRAGWLRTRGSFEALWRDTHIAEPLTFHDLDGWALTPRGA